MNCQDFIKRCLAAGFLRADVLSGSVFIRNGKEARTKSSRGYIVLSVRAFGERKQVKAHQVVWLAAGNDLPEHRVLDHRDRDKTNNALSNLRPVTNGENATNRRSYTGAGNPAAKLNETTARRIREAHRAQASYAKVAAEFSVSK